jgi:hypothetical protein
MNRFAPPLRQAIIAAVLCILAAAYADDSSDDSIANTVDGPSDASTTASDDPIMDTEPLGDDSTPTTPGIDPDADRDPIVMEHWNDDSDPSQLLPAASQPSGQPDAPEFNGPDRSEEDDSAHTPIEPPVNSEDPIMRGRDPFDGSGGDRPEGHEHDQEDRETELRSHGVGSGQDEETPEVTGGD